MSSSIDYYKILGISRDATTQQILKAYKKLALKYHPDRNLNNQEEASFKFQQISEAASILRDSKKRQMYDTYGVAKTEHLLPANIDDFFDMVFSDETKSDSTDKIFVERTVSLTLKDCYHGKTIQQNFEYFYCKSCHLYGIDVKKCNMCDGTGYSNLIKRKQCRNCHRNRYKCSCKDSNLKQCARVVTIQVPAGARHNDIVSTFFEDYITEKNIHITGSVLTNIECKKDTSYELKQNDLYMTAAVPICLQDALCGGEFLLKHFDDDLCIKPNFNLIQSNKWYKIPGKGMTATNGAGFVGDLFCKFEIDIPESLSLNRSDIKQICDILHDDVKHSDDMHNEIEFNLATNNDTRKKLLLTMDKFKSYACKHCDTCIALQDDMHEQGLKTGTGQYIFKNAFNVDMQSQNVLCRNCNCNLGTHINYYNLNIKSLREPVFISNNDIVNQIPINLSLSKCYTGISEQIKFEYPCDCILNKKSAYCSICKGTGGKWKDVLIECTNCNDSSRQYHTIETSATCSQCHGTGEQRLFNHLYKPAIFNKPYKMVECRKCFGEGRIRSTICKVCKGVPKITKTVFETCKSCNGTCLKKSTKIRGCDRCFNGKLQEIQYLDIPAGIGDGEVICHFVEDKQFLIKVNCPKDDEYEVKGTDLYRIKPIIITLCNAFSGCNVIEHFNESLFVKLHSNIIQNDKYYKISGKGMSTPNTSLVGNLFVKFKIKMPTKNQLDENDIERICDIMAMEKNEHQKNFQYVELQELDDFDQLGIDDNDTHTEQAPECKTM